jgi:L-amino acid N-acyltransferase YncA
MRYLSPMNATIRPATHDDLLGILAILNHNILTSTAIYSYTPWSIGQLEEWSATKQRDTMPVLVAVEGTKVLGYGTYGMFRPKEGYRFCVEHSIYIDEAAQGQGIGSAMMRALIASAIRQGLHTMIAGIDASNAESIAFHRRFGFAEVGLLKEVGFKFDRWLDLQFMQLTLPAQETII